jgi:hypothetical protein
VYEEHFRSCIEQICSILDGLGFHYHFTGSLAASFSGEPRFTQDVDLVIQLSADRPETKALLEQLSTHYDINHQAIMEAIRQEGLFQVLDEQTVIKIDFHVGEKIPGELQRSTRQEVLPGLVIRLATKEDAILSKLLWVQKGSEKSKRDVIQMLKGAEDVDRTHLRKQALTLGLAQELDEIEGASSPGHQAGDSNHIN